jgi:phosphoribosylamine---glycine ligase
LGASYTLVMKVLVVGTGGREHALAWKLKQSSKLSQLYVAPGNPGTQGVAENVPAESVEEILAWLGQNPIDLVVIGPDRYLAEGLTDRIQELGIPVFGPTRDAAEIEWSKSYAKQLMRDAGIPTAAYEVFADADSALTYLKTQNFPLVIKADGLAAGKGVIIAQTREEAESTIADMLSGEKFGKAGKRIVIEEYLRGLEISVHAFCDGETAVMFPSSKDHKRIFDGDMGPNTGGMGTIAPVPSVSPEQMELIKSTVVLPLLVGLKKRGRTFKGILFPGIMLTAEGPKVIEFNARFGDPETQSYMLLLESDLLEILLACATGTLASVDVTWRTGSACCIILAAEGYPEHPQYGAPITMLPFDIEGAVFFYAGMTRSEQSSIVSGGRVLGAAAYAATLREAVNNAYRKLSQIEFFGKQYRQDIGASVL